MPEELVPPNIEGYEITRCLGRGGMGAVWHAIQLNTKREVAIKTITGEKLASEHVRQRFQREIELAARLEHPNIAQIYESGMSEGAYYYALQLIDGISFSEYAAGLDDDRDRILLIRKTAAALNYAHQKGVIHRDLKPDNILVSADGEPHILDFGLAKEVFVDQAQIASSQSLTIDGTISGTPAYMSPEQARGDREVMDVRTDVFALGVMFYEVLTGEVPFSARDGLYEWMQRLMTEEAPRPRQIKPTIDPEIEAIVLRALEKDAEKRYGSAVALAEDIDRYLNGDPVLATTHTWTYLLKKRVIKYRIPLGIAAGLIILSVAAVIQYIVSLDREKTRAQSAETRAQDLLVKAEEARSQANAAQTIAEQAQHQAEEVSDFLMEALQSPHPEISGKAVTMAETLDRAREWLDQGYNGSPQSRARLLWAIGQSYNGLASYEKAEQAFGPALKIYEEALGSQHLNTQLVQQGLALALQSQGRLQEAEKLYQRVLQTAGPITTDALHNLAGIHMQQNRFAMAEPLLNKVLTARLKEFGPDAIQTLKVQSNLAVVERRLGRTQAALDRYKSVLDAAGKTLGEDHPVTINARGGAALVLFALDQHDKALELTNDTLQRQQAILGKDHPNTLSTLHNRARIHEAIGDLEAAEQDYSYACTKRESVLGHDNPDTIASALGLAAIHEKSGRIDEAIARYEAYPENTDALEGLAFVYFGQQRFDECEALFRKLFTKHGEQHGETHPKSIDTLKNLVLVQQKQGRTAEAQKTTVHIEALQEQAGRK
jgi:serine/threonine protein kinase/tetratricopeptide (TPR) repeat protein